MFWSGRYVPISPQQGVYPCCPKSRWVPDVSTQPLSLPMSRVATGSAGQASVRSPCHLRSISTPCASPNESLGLDEKAARTAHPLSQAPRELKACTACC